MLSAIATQLQEKLCQENEKEQLAVAVGAGGLLLSAVLGRSAHETAPYPAGQGPQAVTVTFVGNVHV